MLGPPDGRHVLRPGAGGDPSHIVVLHTIGAPVPRGRLSRRPRPKELEPGTAPGVATVPVTRASIVFAALGQTEPPADPELLGEALLVLNRVVRAHRLAAFDPHVREATPAEAIAVRVGRASGEQAAEGRLADGRELPLQTARVRRRAMLTPLERSAALLARREEPLACEELALRARLDLDAGREREAALGLLPALESALAELGPGAGGDVAVRLRELRELRDGVRAAAARAAGGALDPGAVAAVGHALGRLEAVLRARTAAG